MLKNNFLSSFRGFIFDIDGTMIHSMKIHLKVWQMILEKYGISMSIKEIGEKASGINPEIVKRLFGHHLTEAEIDKIADEKEILFRKSFDPEEDVVKGFIQYIQQLKKQGLPIVIGTAAPPENVDFFIDSLGIREFFTGAIHEDDVKKGKPSPEVFLKAAKLINIPIEECVVFEDSPTGAEASAHAGSQTIVLLTSKSRSDFDDIPNIIGFINDYTEL